MPGPKEAQKASQAANHLPDGFQPVESSNITAVRFVEREGLPATEGHIEVLFHNGSAWRYESDRQTFQELLLAPSIGKFYHVRIKALATPETSKKLDDWKKVY